MQLKMLPLLMLDTPSHKLIGGSGSVIVPLWGGGAGRPRGDLVLLTFTGD